MPDTMKISFAVSATPRVELIEDPGKHQAMTVIHENVRKSVGGSGEITAGDLTANAQWDDGDNTAVTSNNGLTNTIDASTDMLVIRHTGYLIDLTTKSEVADSVIIKSASANIIAELTNGESMLFPRPQSQINLATGNGSAHVAVEITVLGGE